MGGARASNFTLRHPSKKKEDLSVQYWETDSCYIKIAPRRLQKRSLMGLDERALITVCVHSFKDEEKQNVWLRFQIHRTRNEISDRVTVYRARALESEAKDDTNEHSDFNENSTEEQEEAVENIKYKDDADYFEDFEYEFEPISDDEED